MKTVIVCVNHRSNPNSPSCGARGSELIASRIEAEIAAQQLPIKLQRFKCLGLCDKGPNLRLAPDGRFFNEVCEATLPEVLRELDLFASNGKTSETFK